MKTALAICLMIPVLFTGVAIAGCGGDSNGESPDPPATEQPSGSAAQPQGNGQGSAPASAGDKPTGDAPDDVISDRPGGPDNQGKSPAEDGAGGTSGGISPPTNPKPAQ